MKKIVMIMLYLPFLFVAMIYIGSEVKLRSYESTPTFSYAINQNQAILDRGQHAMRIRGCFGCHGQQLQGRVFEEQWPWVKRAVAPNLAAYAQQHDVATIGRAIRHGIGADGKAMYSMPSYSFTRLNDKDIAAMIAYMRSAEVVGHDLGRLTTSTQYQ